MRPPCSVQISLPVQCLWPTVAAVTRCDTRYSVLPSVHLCDRSQCGGGKIRQPLELLQQGQRWVSAWGRGGGVVGLLSLSSEWSRSMASASQGPVLSHSGKGKDSKGGEAPPPKPRKASDTQRAKAAAPKEPPPPSTSTAPHEKRGGRGNAKARDKSLGFGAPQEEEEEKPATLVSGPLRCTSLVGDGNKKSLTYYRNGIIIIIE